jgi:phage terminase Nu1 subunit (DNA packaging protein)
MEWTTDAKQLADCFQVTQRQINELILKDMFQGCKIAHGQYNFFLFARAYAKYQRKLGGEPIENTKPGEIDPRYERARYHRAQADKVELENLKTRKEVVLSTSVIEFATSIQIIYKNYFKSFEGRLSGIVSSVVNSNQEKDKLLDAIKEETQQALTGTSNALDAFSNSLKVSGVDKTTATDSSMEMGREQEDSTT